MRHKGTISHWNPHKHYGFITPKSGSGRVFFHGTALANRAVPPVVDQAVEFSLGKDRQGRARAERVTRAGERLPGHGRRLRRRYALFVSIGFFVALALAIAVGDAPEFIFPAYLLASGFTLAVYALDKSSARAGAARVPENLLHLLALLGGWPGALLAQHTLRHKSAKTSFQVKFWVTVVLNCGLLAWLLSTEDMAPLWRLLG